MARSLEEMRRDAEACARATPEWRMRNYDAAQLADDVLALVGVVEERERELASLRDALRDACCACSPCVSARAIVGETVTAWCNECDLMVLPADLTVGESASSAAVSSEGVDG